MFKRFLFSIFVCLIVFSVASAARIYDCNDLQNMRNDLTADYILMNDINCSETVYWNDGLGFEPIGQLEPFTGSFDGRGFIIYNLTINRSNEDYVGLFGRGSMTIRRVGLEDHIIRGKDNVAGLVGRFSGNMDRCFVRKSEGSDHSKGWIYGEHNVGGVIGFNSGIITNSYNVGSRVRRSGDSISSRIGGFVGSNPNGTIKYSYVASSVYAQEGLFMQGAFAGYATSNRVFVRNYFGILNFDAYTAEGELEGREYSEMRYPYDEDTYVDWDFVRVWSNDINGDINRGYPVLAWETHTPSSGFGGTTFEVVKEEEEEIDIEEDTKFIEFDDNLVIIGLIVLILYFVTKKRRY